jgi:leucyl aminopeptidase
MLARGLAVTPSNLKNPAWMAQQAQAVARSAGLEVRVWSDDDLRRDGFGGLLAVGGGSATPPRLVQLDHTPAGRRGGSARRVVLVGKGITFDSGGLDIKPRDGMLAMKTDMSGAAVVLAVLAACRALEVPVRVTGLLALAENAVGGSSYRPGDVVTQFGGTTVEIGNTDAEGRIVMADALAYADRHLDPDVLVDVATLTGAARVALARSAAPVYSTDDVLRAELVAAGERVGEPLWPFPLVEDYRPLLDSEVADVNHVSPGSGGGSITAALFLREFVGARRWAHLDIAGPGRSDVDKGILGKGATGFGARLLLSWLEGLA